MTKTIAELETELATIKTELEKLKADPLERGEKVRIRDIDFSLITMGKWDSCVSVEPTQWPFGGYRDSYDLVIRIPNDRGYTLATARKLLAASK